MTSRSQDRDQMVATLRQQALEDAEKFADKPRFALFSQPPSLATGDDKQYEMKLHPRDETGKPVTQPKNVQAGAPKQGKVKDSYFSVLGFTTIGDPFVDPDSIRRKYELEKKKLVAQEVFKPASGYKNIYNSPYKNEPEYIHKEKNYCDSEGKVITAPRNITTNPKNGPIQKHAPYIPDPYERQRELRIKEMEEHKKKLAEKQAFRTTHHGGGAFNSGRKLFGEEGIDIKKRPQTVTKYNIIKHEAPFKPSNPGKKGLNGTISKFPEYKPDPLKPLKRVDKPKDKDPFKPKHCGNLTRPTPTITCNAINIRKDIMNGRQAIKRRVNFPQLNFQRLSTFHVSNYNLNSSQNTQNHHDNSNEESQVIIVENKHHQKLQSEYFKQKDYLQKHKFLDNNFYPLLSIAAGLSLGTLYENLYLFSLSIPGFYYLNKSEKILLKINNKIKQRISNYDDLYKQFNIMLINKMCNHSRISKYFTQETLCMKDPLLQKLKVNKKIIYKYEVSFFDLKSGALGDIKTEIEFQDEKFASRKIEISLDHPERFSAIIEDPEHTINIM
ncbi:hypothetical protein ABPG72_021302 [Tetrahymena utriculariae]